MNKRFILTRDRVTLAERGSEGKMSYVYKLVAPEKFIIMIMVI